MIQGVRGIYGLFQHTAARRRLQFNIKNQVGPFWFQHTAARRRLVCLFVCLFVRIVSTHSRPKAAVSETNTIPMKSGFNTQPPEGGWRSEVVMFKYESTVSTHSRPKAAAVTAWPAASCKGFNTQPPEGGCCFNFYVKHCFSVSTHSRPKAAAEQNARKKEREFVSTHSRPKAAAI